MKISEFNDEVQPPDSDEDPEIIPNTEYKQLKLAYDVLEKEKENVEEKLKNAEKKLCEFQKCIEEMKMECTEVEHLRSLNRQLQEKLLDAPQGNVSEIFLICN